MKLHKGDTVIIRSGKDRRKKGKIIKVDTKSGKITVEGINVKIKHRKPRRAGEKGSKIEMLAGFPAGKAQLVCSKCGAPTRVGYKITGATKARICKKCGGEI